jgi:hypothetical protein
MTTWYLLFRPPEFDWGGAMTSEDYVNQAEAYFLRVRNFYDCRARWHRRFHRLSGVLIIVLGGLLPLLAGGAFPHKDVFIAIIGFVVATITALRGFYRWDSGWVLLRETEFLLTKRYLAWKAQQVTPSDQNTLWEETKKLLQDLIAIREDEARSFFKDLPLPGQAREGNNKEPDTPAA